MSDDVDRAQQHETFRRELSIRAVRAGAAELQTPAGFGLCEDCDCPIEAARREALPGARRCIHCQERAEGQLRLQCR